MILLIKHHLQVKLNLKKINKEYFGFLDEYALVTALKDMGIVFSGRTPDSAIINFVNKLNFIFF